MIHDDIKNFPEQFLFEPRVQSSIRTGDGVHAKKFEQIIVAGMGGSHLAADILKTWHPELPITVWSDYGLPHIPANKIKKTLFIASSYSGNTEETTDAMRAAKKRGIALAALAAGGEIIALAKKYGAPYVEMPNLQIQPRLALGYSMKALLALLGEKKLSHEISKLSKQLLHIDAENFGKHLAQKLHGRMPVIYASTCNAAIAYNWKIKLNETGKIPAFCNTVPELNHNEMSGFGGQKKSAMLSRKFYFLFLKDAADDARIVKRMDALEKIYRSRGHHVEIIELAGATRLVKIFSSLMCADWTAFFIARACGIDPESVPLVGEFKKMIAI